MRTLWRPRNVLVLSAVCALSLCSDSLSAASLSVNGSGSYVSVPTDPNLTPSQFTLEAWVKVSGAGSQTIVSRGDGSNGSVTDYILQLSNDGFTGGNEVSLFAGNAWDVSSSSIPLNTWTHVAVTYDGKNKLFYINGVLDRSAPRANSIYSTPSSPMYIGRQGSVCNCNFFNGTIAEVRVWNTIRTADQIAADMNFSYWGKQPGLVAYYHLNEGGGTVANDASGNGHTGTLNAASWSSTAPQSLGTIAALEGNAAGIDSIALSSPAGAWTAKTNAPWLHLSAANQSGSGSTNVIFSFDANPGLTRTGMLTVAGINVTITQAGTNYTAASGLTTLFHSNLVYPAGVAVDGVGNVYFADDAASTVSEWMVANNSVTNLVSRPNVFDPYDVAVDGIGNVYIDDTDDSAIKEWVAATKTLTTLVSSGLSYPMYGLGLDTAGNVYISDSFSNAIKELSVTSHAVSTIISSGVFLPDDVAADIKGNLYIANYGIYRWSPSNPTLVYVGFSEARSVAVDGAGNIYASSTDGSVGRWSATTGTVSTVASNGLGSAWGVAVDGGGNLYIGDNGGQAIKELCHAFLDPRAQWETLAGGSNALPVVLPATANLSPSVPWDDTNNLPWLTITGVSNGVVSFAFTASTTNRAGNITLLGQNIPVLQFNDMLSTNTIYVESAAGTNSVVLTVNPAATQTWTAISLDSWVHFNATSGSGSGPVTFTFDTNHGSQRTGTLAIAGQVLSVVQSAAPLGTSSILTEPEIMGDGSFQFKFTNTPGASFTVLFSTNPSLPLNLWAPIGVPIENPAGQFQFIDPAVTNSQGFYNVRSP